MPEYKFTDETAMTIALRALVNDMKHALEWITWGLVALTTYWVIHAIGDGLRRDWIWLGFDLVLGGLAALWAHDTFRRARKYHSGGAR